MQWDLFKAQKSEGGRHCKSFVLWPDKWRNFNWSSPLVWKDIPANKSAVKQLPDVPGVYAFVIIPGIANFPLYGIIAYVGETKGATQSLKKRCAVYFRESEYNTRPHIGEMMELWPDNLRLYYAEAPAADVPALEDALLLAYIPPFNRKFPGKFNKLAANIYHY